MRLLNRPPKTLEERYFSEIRPQLYTLHAHHRQHGVRQSRTLAEHLDSACQFALTVSRIAGIPDDKRAVILAATAVHDLNKLDKSGRNVKTLARDKEFLREQLEKAGVYSFVSGDAELELARRLIERHSGHHPTDGALFLPEDPQIQRWASILIAADLFDLDLPSEELIPKVRKELVNALGRPSELYRIRISEDRGYMTALLLSASEEVFKEHGLIPLAIFPDGALFEGEKFPKGNLTKKIAARWQAKIKSVFGSNINQLVKPGNNGIRIMPQAVQQDLNEVVEVVLALLEKKKSGYKADKVQTEINKHVTQAGQTALTNASAIGLMPVTNAEEFALSEGLKAVFVSYGEVKPKMTGDQRWGKIAAHVGLSKQQCQALQLFDAQYGRSLIAAGSITRGIEGIKEALMDSLERRKLLHEDTEECEVDEQLLNLVRKSLSLSEQVTPKGFDELNAYIAVNPKKRCSLGSTASEAENISSNAMPIGTKVQVFSNRLPGGMASDPTRQAEPTTLLAYHLLAIGANLPKSKNEPPFYLHLALPQGSCPELLRIWRECLQKLASINAEGGPITVDEIRLYKDNIIEFLVYKGTGFAFPKRLEFVHATVTLPLVWGDANTSVALLKSLRLALELSLSLEFGFPFVLSASLQIEPSTEFYGSVEGIPTAFANLLGSGRYDREGAVTIRNRLRWLGNLVQAVSSLPKFDDCLYKLARATSKPFSLYYVLLRWILREQDDPNFEAIWKRIRAPLNYLLESLMPDENKELTKYLKEAAQIAAEASLRGSSFKRTSLTKPFTDFLKAIRSQKSYMDLDFMFAALSQEFYNYLDRIDQIWDSPDSKHKKVTRYYNVLRNLYQEVYNARPEKLLSDREHLEAAYLFFWQEAYQVVKAKRDAEKAKAEATKASESTQATV